MERMMRERMPIPRALIDQMPHLRAICTTPPLIAFSWSSPAWCANFETMLVTLPTLGLMCP
jgi:hypothetical protein